MRPSVLASLLAFSVSAPAFAADITGYKISKQPASPCSIRIDRVYQEDPAGPVHVVLLNLTKYHTVGKLTAGVMVGTSITADGSNFSFNGTPNQRLDLVVNRNPKGVVTGAKTTLAFQECTIAMN